jgi:hypothetical protein
MTIFQKLDKALAARGWWYDPAAERFKSSTGALDLKNVYSIVPGMTLDDLANYQDDQYTQLCKRRVRPN